MLMFAMKLDNEHIGRYHIDEIMISGAIYKELEEYKYGKSILINYDQHLLLYHIICYGKYNFSI